MKTNEKWLPIEGFERYYEISNYGKVRRQFRKHQTELFGNPNKDGYLMVFLCTPHNKKTEYIHRLVGIHFIPNPNNKKTINHKSGIKSDNSVSNLEWSTQSENILHSFKVLKRKSPEGKQSCLKKEDVIEIRNSNLKGNELAKIYGVHKSTISNIKAYRSFKNI
jgi:hypothetical protein